MAITISATDGAGAVLFTNTITITQQVGGGGTGAVGDNQLSANVLLRPSTTTTFPATTGAAPGLFATSAALQLTTPNLGLYAAAVRGGSGAQVAAFSGPNSGSLTQLTDWGPRAEVRNGEWVKVRAVAPATGSDTVTLIVPGREYAWTLTARAKTLGDYDNMVSWFEGADAVGSVGAAVTTLPDRWPLSTNVGGVFSPSGLTAQNWTVPAGGTGAARTAPVKAANGGVQFRISTDALYRPQALNATGFTVVWKAKLDAFPPDYAPFWMTGAYFRPTIRAWASSSTGKWGTVSTSPEYDAGASLSVGRTYTFAMVGSETGGGTFYLDGAANGTWPAGGQLLGSDASLSSPFILIGSELFGGAWDDTRFLPQTVFRRVQYQQAYSGADLTSILSLGAA